MEGQIPELRHLEVGTDVVRSPRSYDLALLARFESLEGLRAYQVHPVHVQVSEYMSSVRESTVSVDYEATRDVTDREFRPLLSERLRLRRFTEEDAEPFWRYRTDDEVAKYQGEVSSYTREMALAFAREQSVQEPDVPGTWSQLAIELVSSGELIGDCGLHTLLDCPEQVELGITIARPHQGKGYAREALAAVLDYVFGPLGKHRAIALTDPENAACIRLLEGLGMRREAHFVKHVQVRGEWVDDFQYALLAEEFRQS
jgi:RimJ/RimL family protein N-acetyltransferase